MKEKIQLKFPSGEFTHTMLAEFNNHTNQQIWTVYQEAIKNGTIVFVGERKGSSGKGKPSKWYRVADGTPVVLVNDIQAVNRPERQKNTPKPVVVEHKLILPESIETLVADTIAKKIKLTPINTLTVNDLKVQPVTRPEVIEPVVEVSFVPKNHETQRIMRPTNFKCPICQQYCVAWDDETGVTVYCNQKIEVCKSTENPFGHGRNEKSAYEILCEKYRHVNK